MNVASKLRDEVKKMKQVEQKIRDEIQGGKIRQDFLLLLLQYVKEMTKTDELLQELKEDIEIMMQILLAEIRGVIEKIAPFMIVVQREPGLGKKVEAARDKFLEQQQKIMQAIKREGGWPRVQLADAQKLTEAESKLISVLIGVKEGAIKKLKDNLINIELGES